MIRQLPRDVIERIAAGEVIERPASVVKELVENSLDAGATRIEVETAQGGKVLIRVTDDGVGVGEEDLLLAFAPHATSKLTELDDLLEIASYGFRGEALSSVGAVARARIRSRSRDARGAFEISCEGGKIGPLRPCGAPAGTTVEVSNLFYNVPARARFLKSDGAETSRCLDHVIRMAIANEGVGFSMKSSGRKLYEVPASAGRRERIAAAYGEKLASDLIHVREKVGGIWVEALLGTPEIAKASVRHQQTALNGRLVRDTMLRAAARQAYREFLAPALQPVFFLLLCVDPSEVDVNVHPAKVEVRFRNSQQIFRAVRSTVLDGLRRSDLAPRPSLQPLPAQIEGGGIVREWPDPVPVPDRRQPLPAQSPLFPVSEQQAVPAVPARTGRGILGVFDTYLVYQSGKELVLVDQHALHERVLYEQLRRELERGGIARQRLLLPEIVEVGRDRVLALEDAWQNLERLGLEVAPMSETELAVSTVPALLKNARVEELLFAALDTEVEGEQTALEERLHTLACHGAVRAGDRLEQEAAEALLQQAEELPEAKSCPHGRPTSVRLPMSELERWFKRTGF
ncbi:MAG: DNA mismatch repair endonuclease MutL [Planctomycetota bacterium]